MDTPPRKEHPSTYFVQDRSNEEELVRLRTQDQMLTAGMGGVLPEQSDPSRFQHVLDVGCGTGGWLIAAARTYPTMTRLVGVDVSKKMIDYARAQAESQGVADRVEFHVMDALRMLEFPRGYFDLINQRLGVSYLRLWDWEKLLSEYERIGKKGAVIRITESDSAHGNSPGLMTLSTLFFQALHTAGHLKSPEMDATLSTLVSLLQRHGIQNVQAQQHPIIYPAGTPEGQAFYEDMRHFYRTLVPFLRKWTSMPDDYDAIYERALVEMQQPGFVGVWNMLTAWGDNPGRVDTPRTLLEQH